MLLRIRIFSCVVVLILLSATRVLAKAIFPIHPQTIASQANDSATYYLKEGQDQKARIWIDRALQLQSGSQDRAMSYFLLGELEESEGYTTKSLTAFRKSLNLAVRDKIVGAFATRGIANALVGLARYDSVLFYVSQSLKVDSLGENLMMNHLVSARLWQVRNKHDKAIRFYQLAFDKAQQLKLNKFMATALAGMAGIYFTQDPGMKKTLAYLKKSNALCDSVRDANIIARNFTRMANAYMVLGNSKEAERYLTRAQKITDLSGNLPVRAYVLSSFAILKAEEGDIEGALQYAEEPAAIKRKLGQARQLQNDLLNIAEWNIELKKYSLARTNINEGLQTSIGLKDVVYIQYFYERSARLDSLTGNYRSAYSNLKKASQYKDSVIASQRVNAVEDIREKYEAEQREKVIVEKEVEIEHQKFQQSVIVGASAISIMIFVVILIVIRNQHSAHLEREKQKQNQLRLQTIVHTQEDVQQIIARDIHDGLVQVLGAAKISLESIQEHGDKSAIMDRVKNASQIMDEACVEARAISHQLLPYSLLKDGLIPALEELFRKSLRDHEFKKSGEPRKISGDIAINIYRIAQELVNNIIKHAEAEKVTIQFFFLKESVVFVVADNGKGFATRDSYDGVGMMNMQTRAGLINGVFEIESTHGAGTRVKLTVPL